MIKEMSTDGLQYVMEVDNSPSVFALYLLLVFGHLLEATVQRVARWGITLK